jgi:hypothetical protein
VLPQLDVAQGQVRVRGWVYASASAMMYEVCSPCTMASPRISTPCRLTFGRAQLMLRVERCPARIEGWPSPLAWLFTGLLRAWSVCSLLT